MAGGAKKSLYDFQHRTWLPLKEQSSKVKRDLVYYEEVNT